LGNNPRGPELPELKPGPLVKGKGARFVLYFTYPVTSFPSNRNFPPGILTSTSAAGPWHTAETTLPASKNSAAMACDVGSEAKSNTGPWPPQKKMASNSCAPRPSAKAESSCVFSQTEALVRWNSRAEASSLEKSTEEGSRGATPPWGDATEME